MIAQATHSLPRPAHNIDRGGRGSDLGIGTCPKSFNVTV